MNLPKFSRIVPVLASCLWGVTLHAQAPPAVPINQTPSRVVGHPRLVASTGNPNLVEGRELFNPQSVAVDAARNFVYVSDFGNNRVLGWRNASTFANGAPSDIVIGQLDRFSTFNLGPGTSLSTGLNAPTAVGVDALGNLWVADAGNNRVLRYPPPFDQQGSILPNLVVGRPNFLSRNPNQGLAAPTAQTLALGSGGTAFRGGIIFDPQGNMWVSDGGNNRVLRYSDNAVRGNTNNPAANMVIGQSSYTTNVALGGTNPQVKTNIRAPSGIALDQSGRLYVTDYLSRVLVFESPFFEGKPPARIMGAVTRTAAQFISAATVGLGAGAGAEGVFTIGDTAFVVDTNAHRILRFPPFDQWPAEQTAFSPSAVAVIGQDDFVHTSTNLPKPNRGQLEPLNNAMSSPIGAVFANGEVYVVDTGNHRVIVFPDLSTGPAASPGDPYLAKRVLGQIGFEFRSANLIEGREFQFIPVFPVSGPPGAGIAVDSRSDPPRLYVADPYNHRVLGFADARKVRPGDKAEIVIGQVDFNRALINSPTNVLDNRGDTGLAFPFGVAVDPNGNLWVADSGNSRVLRYSAPFGQPAKSGQKADLVLGQLDVTSRITDPTSQTMSFPYGLAFTVEGNLAVSDSAHHRVLLFRAPFTTGMQADRVFGQPDFTTATAGNTGVNLNSPKHISIDTDGRLYVADAANNRVQIFANVNGVINGPSAALTLSAGVNTPFGVVVSPLTGEIWVASTNANNVFRYPRFDVLVGNNASTQTIPSNLPLALALDGFGNLFIADTLSRIAIHFPTVAGINAANGFQRFTPGMYTGLYATNYTFTDKTRNFNELPNPLPIPTTLEDIQVLVNDIPAPITLVSPGQINFVLPYGLPNSGTVEVQVVQASLGRIIAATKLTMDVASPGFFSTNFSGQGQLLALNQDGSLNSATNRIQRGQVIQLFGTGAGKIAGAPADGFPAPSASQGLIFTDPPPQVRVFISGAEAVVQYSGLAPGLVSVWQVNAFIPSNIAPSTTVLVTVFMYDVPNNGGNPNFRGTIAVQ